MANTDKKWSGLISNIRISETADQELFNDLKASAHRERARRLRTLATIGLFALNQQRAKANFEIEDDAAISKDPTERPKVRSKLSNLKGSL